jgi:hypothetical protein
VVNDVFFPWQRYKVDSNFYRKDRGYMFEKKFDENTDYILDKRVSDYSYFEQQAKIPMMVISPTIIDDGRRLLISPLPVSYLAVNSEYFEKKYPMKVDGIDAKSFFKNQNGENLLFTSALRMNATFPFVLPNTYLPTHPQVQCMDAGMRDNYGMESSLRFLTVFKDWIGKNCSSVIIVQSRGDYEKNYEPIVTEHPSLIQKITDPVNSLYAIWSDYQDYHEDDMMNQAEIWLGVKLHVLSFEYVPEKKDQTASMSLHLTTREKQNILQTIYNPYNQKQLAELVALLPK